MQLKANRVLLSPSDVTGYLGCEHLTTLSLRVALGELEKPTVENEQAELVFRKGREHEEAYLARLRAEGKDVVEISLEPDLDWERAARETEEAIAGGVDVVYQGVLADGRWRGVADFLERQPDGSYEAVDTKLARHAKPAYILQLCFYSEQLARIQGREPDADPRAARERRARVVPAAGVRRLRAARPRAGSSGSSPSGRPRAPYPCEPVRDLRLQAALRRGVGRDRQPLPRRRRRAARDGRSSSPPGSRRSPRSRMPAEPAGLNADRFDKLRRQAALQLQRKRDRRARRSSSSSRTPNPASRCCPTRRPATSSSTSRATRSGTSRARSSTSGASPTRTTPSRRAGRTTTRASGARSRTSST